MRRQTTAGSEGSAQVEFGEVMVGYPSYYQPPYLPVSWLKRTVESPDSIAAGCDRAQSENRVESHCGKIVNQEVLAELTKLNRRALRIFHSERLKGKSEIVALVAAVRWTS